jgi:CCR4-NOT transcription complex subunit 9
MYMQVATFILQKILLDEDGLACICATADRFFSVCRILNMVMEKIQRQPSPRLLKFIIPCYARLSQNPRLVEQFHNLKFF